MSSLLIDAVRPHLPADLDRAAYLGASEQQDLLQALAAVPDPRHRRGVRYRLASLLAVAVCAVLAGAGTFAAIADSAADLDPPARRRLGFAGRIPVGSTVWRFLVQVDATVLQAVPTAWLRCRLPQRPAAAGHSGQVVIAVDGKLMRGARLPAGRQVHLLSTYEVATGIVLGPGLCGGEVQRAVQAARGVLVGGKIVWWLAWSTPRDLGAGEPANELGAGAWGRCPGLLPVSTRARFFGWLRPHQVIPTTLEAIGMVVSSWTWLWSGWPGWISARLM